MGVVASPLALEIASVIIAAVFGALLQPGPNFLAVMHPQVIESQEHFAAGIANQARSCASPFVAPS